MIIKKYVSLIAVGACLVGLSVLGSTKNPVTRPHKGVGHFHTVINVGNPYGTGDFSFEARGVGQGTHTGEFHSYLKGYMAPAPNPRSEGTVTAANGDQLFIKGEPDGSTSTTGGTGRFEGATGNVISTTVGDPVISYDADTGLLTWDGIQTLEGTITY
jgi:hypothetical protein